MAEIVLTAVINKSIEITGNLLLQEGSRLYWLQEDNNWLQKEMRHILSYLDYAKAKVVKGDSRVRSLIKVIEELADDVEDILDTFLPKTESHKAKGAVGSCIHFHPFSAHKFAMKIEKIKRRVADIDRVRTTYGIMDTSDHNDQHDNVPLDRRRLFLHADETEVIGLDHDFKLLEAKLLHQDSDYGVISIVGLPGLGKTTLAKKLYRQLYNKFECSALVYVSQQPRLGELLLDIAKQVGLEEAERRDNLINNLRSHLKENKYVILLDDIWNTEIWDDLKHALPECDSRTGSRIMITSRNNSVGRYIGGDSSLHMLEPLDLEKSFELFSKKILTFGLSNLSPTLDKIGKEIVKRCGGVPLAIMVIAGMLRARERTEHAWTSVLESMDQNIQDDCAKILTLSYNDLPIALRPCFLYFGLFPEDHEIRTFELTNMWISEKFISVSNGNRREAEDMAEDLLNDLASRNLIQVSKRTCKGRIGSCRIHDLLHTLCIVLARDCNFFHGMDNTSGDVARVRRLTFSSGNVDEYFCSNPKPRKLRAMLCFDGPNYTFSLKSTRVDLKLLRVLRVVILSRHKGITVPKEIVNMSCLGYLQLMGCISGELPWGVVKLQHLKTLDVRGSSISLPSCVWAMKQLRHLRCDPCTPERYHLDTINVSLPNLQTLLWMSINHNKARWLHQLTNLRKLGISVVSNSVIEVLSSTDSILPKLEVLKLDGSSSMVTRDLQQINLSSYHNLLKLHLSGFVRMPVHVEAFPPNLVKLSFSCVNLCHDTPEMIERLPELRIIKTDGDLHERKLDVSGAYIFPQLEWYQSSRVVHFEFKKVIIPRRIKH